MKNRHQNSNTYFTNLDDSEVISIIGGGLWDDFWRMLGRRHGRRLCSNVPPADWEAAWERYRRGSMI